MYLVAGVDFAAQTIGRYMARGGKNNVAVSIPSKR